MKDHINVLFIGDIVGEPGYKYAKEVLPELRRKYEVDFVIANGENINDTNGILERDAKKLLELGIDVLTGGNHTLDKIQAHSFIKNATNVLRPYNYPKGVYGNGYGIYSVKDEACKIGVISLMGRVYLKYIDCPFRGFDEVYKAVSRETKIVFVDFHAEASAEKIAFFHYADGRASAVVGTHTHVQTADERISENGTAYITDAGMTGAYDSVIGTNKESAIKRFIYSTPHRHEVAVNDVKFAGMFYKINKETGKSEYTERIFFPEFKNK